MQKSAQTGNLLTCFRVARRWGFGGTGDFPRQKDTPYKRYVYGRNTPHSPSKAHQSSCTPTVSWVYSVPIPECNIGTDPRTKQKNTAYRKSTRLPENQEKSFLLLLRSWPQLATVRQKGSTRHLETKIQGSRRLGETGRILDWAILSLCL